MRIIACAGLVGALFLSVSQVQANLLITELMAANDGFLLDENGDPSDWFEVHNDSDSAVSVNGWYATDDPGDLRKWAFPNRTLPARGFLLVFASGKDRRPTTGEVHANFALDDDGEYLALVQPDGQTVESQFSPFPTQASNYSYGFPIGGEATEFVTEGALASAFVPVTNIGQTWTGVGYNDAAWTAGVTGVGFDMGDDYTGLIGLDLESSMHNANSTAYVRIPFNLASVPDIDSLLLRMKYDDGFVAYLNGTEIARRNAPLSPAWNSRATAEHGQPTSGLMEQDFDGGGTPYVLTAHGENVPPIVVSGGPSGRYLQLTPDDTGSLSNTVGFSRVHGASDRVVAEFDFRMPTEASHTGCCGERADGFGFALIDTAVYETSGPGPDVGGIVWERPAYPSAFAVGFDIFNGSGTENTVNLNWDGAEAAAHLLTQFALNNGVFNRVRIEINANGNESLVSMWITPNIFGGAGAPVQVFSEQRIAGMRPFDWRVAFGARTGGAFVKVDLDNINVAFEPLTNNIPFEDIDVTDSLGVLQPGNNVLAVHGLNRTTGDPDFLVLPRLEGVNVGSVQTNRRVYFDTPTPGEANVSDGLTAIAPDPVFSFREGTFYNSFTLQFTGGGAQAEYRYTTNGSEPSQSSTLYTGPITISNTTTIRARTYIPNHIPSRAVRKHYVELHPDVANFSSNLPIVVIDTHSRTIGNGWTNVHATIIDSLGARAQIQGIPDFAGKVAMKLRGSSSSGFPKKQYAFEVRDEFDDDLDAPILGMPPQSDWVLYAPYSDKSLIRNILSYGWSNEIGPYAPRTRACEVYMNTLGGRVNSGHYLGVYVFMEKIKRDRKRVDIANLRPSDNSEPEITGGYILKKDRLDPGDSGFRTSRNYLLNYVDPKENEITSAQANWIRNWINTFEAALYGSNFRDPNVGYRRYIDVPSFVDHHILTETMKNIDGYRLSTFMYKDRGGKLTMGPLWDYNLSLGNANYLEGWLSAGWYYPQVGGGDYLWYARLFQDPEFVQQYIDRWTELRHAHFETAQMMGFVDFYRVQLQESQARNFQRWQILGTYVWPNWYIADTWIEEINWMKGWLDGRLTWIDNNWLPPPEFNQDGGVLPAGFELFMSSPGGSVYYTLDGPDPRVSGGGIAPEAQEFSASEVIELLSPQTHNVVRAWIPTSGAVDSQWTNTSFNDGSWTQGNTGIGVGYEAGSGYEPFIDLDVIGMRGQNGSVYIRVPFNVADPSGISFLTLKMKYDDGFIAYLNGTEIARSNAAGGAQWDSLASAQNSDTAAVVDQDFNLSDADGLLRSGTNILAIHGLNATIDSSDLLMVPTLVGSRIDSGDALPISETTVVRARTKLGNTWSGLREEVFVTDDDLPLRITEVMYHPRGDDTQIIYDEDMYEFVEVKNISAGQVHLGGVRFVDGIEFDFTGGSVPRLGPGEYVLVVRNLGAFSSVYDTTGMNIAGEYAGAFDNGGEQIILLDGRGQSIHTFSYLDAWYPETDGNGFSLTIRDELFDPSLWNTPGSWKLSSSLDGTPGVDDTGLPPSGGRQFPGDANQDARLDISDAIALMRLQFGGGNPLPCDGDLSSGGNLTLFDLNDDNGVDISDVLYLLNYLFNNGPAPTLGSFCVRIEGCPAACGF